MSTATTYTITLGLESPTLSVQAAKEAALFLAGSEESDHLQGEGKQAFDHPMS